MGPVRSEIIIMKAFIFATILAVATAIPIEDTDEVKAAKAEHAAAHAEAEARALGEPVATAYLAAFQAVFDKYAAGEVALPVAPVHEVPAVVAPAVAPVAVAAPYWNAAYPYAAAAYTGYAGYAGYYGYPYGYYGKAAACVNAANVPVPCA